MVAKLKTWPQALSTLSYTSTRASAAAVAPDGLRPGALSACKTPQRLQQRSISTTPPKQSASSSTLYSLALLLGGGTLGLGYATLFPTPLSRMLNPPFAPPSPTHDSDEGQAHRQDLERQLQALPQVKALRAEQEPSQSPVTSLTPESSLLKQPKWKELRPYAHYPEERRLHHLTAGILRGPGKLALPPLCFAAPDGSQSIIFMHLGRSLCGHDGIVHGGLLTTLLDEGLAFPAFSGLPNKIGVTANLSVDFKAPCFADQFVVLRSKISESKGRKAWSEGTIETLDGTVLVKAKALYVEPKMAALLKNSNVAHAMGEP